jgi:hypothetical protein
MAMGQGGMREGLSPPKNSGMRWFRDRDSETALPKCNIDSRHKLVIAEIDESNEGVRVRVHEIAVVENVVVVRDYLLISFRSPFE